MQMDIREMDTRENYDVSFLASPQFHSIVFCKNIKWYPLVTRNKSEVRAIK